MKWNDYTGPGGTRTATKVIMTHIPNTQMPFDTKQLLVEVLSKFHQITGGIIENPNRGWISQYNRGYIEFRNTFSKILSILHEDRNLFETVIQMWRDAMATQTTRKPLQIEYIIRRFIKALYN